MLVHGEVTGVRGQEIVIKLPKSAIDTILRYREGNSSLAEIRLNDGRTVTNEQRKKYYATLKDITEHTGELIEHLHDYFKAIYCYKNRLEKISMSNCSVTEAREIINLVMDFVIENGIPLKDFGLNRTDDIGSYLYSCLVNRSCVCCGKPADIHHVTGYRIGMGMDRDKVNHVGRKAIALCRTHHTEAHYGEKDFFNKWKVYGIKLDEYTVKILGL